MIAKPLPSIPPETLDIAKLYNQFGALMRRASTLPPPQTAEPIRLDACNAGRENDNAKKLS